jgi:hypothetical protein
MAGIEAGLDAVLRNHTRRRGRPSGRRRGRRGLRGGGGGCCHCRSFFPKRSLRAYARIWTYCFADHLLRRRRQFGLPIAVPPALAPGLCKTCSDTRRAPSWASDVRRQCFSSCSTCGCRTLRRRGHRFRILPSRSSEPATERHSPATMNRRNPWVVPLRFDVARTVASGTDQRFVSGIQGFTRSWYVGAIAAPNRGRYVFDERKP